MIVAKFLKALHLQAQTTWSLFWACPFGFAFGSGYAQLPTVGLPTAVSGFAGLLLSLTLELTNPVLKHPLMPKTFVGRFVLWQGLMPKQMIRLRLLTCFGSLRRNAHRALSPRSSSSFSVHLVETPTGRCLLVHLTLWEGIASCPLLLASFWTTLTHLYPFFSKSSMMPFTICFTCDENSLFRIQ